MQSAVEQALKEYLLAMGDDEFLLGHRDSEWCGHAPILEEDIAFANIALDEIGHAGLWYGLLADLEGAEGTEHANRLIYWREEPDFRNAQLVELPNGDWAFSMLRQFLFDAYENVRLQALSESAYAPLEQVAGRVRREEAYHLRHSQAWVTRLAQGTEESHRRMQAALVAIWPFTPQLFAKGPGESLLVDAGIAPASEEFRPAWEARLLPLFSASDLQTPAEAVPASRSEHTQHLKTLLADLQSVARLDPQAGW